jgi:hypothetical protein
MGTFTITIETRGAAFEEPGITQEVARILRDTAARMDWRIIDSETTAMDWVLRDINGNLVGRAAWER